MGIKLKRVKPGVGLPEPCVERSQLWCLGCLMRMLPFGGLPWWTQNLLKGLLAVFPRVRLKQNKTKKVAEKMNV